MAVLKKRQRPCEPTCCSMCSCGQLRPANVRWSRQFGDLCFTRRTVSARRAEDDDAEDEVDAVAEEEDEGREEGQGEEGQGESKKARDIADARSGRLATKGLCAVHSSSGQSSSAASPGRPLLQSNLQWMKEVMASPRWEGMVSR